MQYYIEYLDNSVLEKSECGILTYEEQKYYVNGNEVLNNRGITNDIVYINESNEVIGIKTRENKYFIGILYIESKTKYGIVNGKNKYLFKSLNKKFSDFFVTSKHKNEKNMYVKIEFKDWDKKDKLPNGSILEYLGYVENIEATQEALRYYYDIAKPVMKIKNDKIQADLKTLESIDYFDYEIFSIDPEGSLDIDDAFHFNKMSDWHNDYSNVVKYEVGVHIASPTHFLFDYIEEIMSRVSTVYLENKKYPMLPAIYSDNILSLLENNKRVALSVIYTFDAHFKLENYRIQECNVINLKNYTYEEFDLLLKKKQKILNNVEKNNVEFFNFTKILFNMNDSMDSHLFVEKWMIYTNNNVAKYLIKHNVKNVIIRTQKSPKIIDKINDNIDESVLKYINIKNETSAKYEIYDPQKNNSSNYLPNHYRLNLDFYTHYTSPIRRSVDFYIHALFLGKNNIFSTTVLNNMIVNINTFTKNQRKFQRQLRRLSFLVEIKNKYESKNDNNLITEAYIIEIKDRFLVIYIPEYKLEEKICIIQKKFEKIIKSNIVLNDNNEIEKINIIDETLEYTYELYQKIMIKMYVFLSFDSIFDKVKIEIVK
jgi:ribonuclease R